MLGAEQVPTIVDWMPVPLIVVAVGIPSIVFALYWIKRGWWKFIEHKPRIEKN